MKSLTIGLCLILSAAFGGCNSNLTKPPTEILVSAPDADAAEPAVAADTVGNTYVLYVEHGADKMADVYLQKFGSDARASGERVRINPEAGRATAWRGDPPTVKIGDDGTVYVGWTARIDISEGSANDLLLSISHDGGKTFAAPVKVNDDRSPAVHGMHSLEIDQAGRVYFAWLDERYLKTGTQTLPMADASIGE